MKQKIKDFLACILLPLADRIRWWFLGNKEHELDQKIEIVILRKEEV